MSNSKNCASSAQTIGGASLLQKQISALVTQVQPQATILPYVNNLPAGKYSSEIIDVADAVQKGVIVGIDCTHKLTSENGNVTFVKFRFFEPIDTSALIQVLASYGLSGNICNALKGLKEIVDIAPRPNSARYVYIAHRDILNAQNNVTSAISNTPPGVFASKSPAKNRIGSSYFGSKRGNKPSPASKASLLTEDDDFDDWEDDGDED